MLRLCGQQVELSQDQIPGYAMKPGVSAIKCHHYCSIRAHLLSFAFSTATTKKYANVYAKEDGKNPTYQNRPRCCIHIFFFL